MTKKIISVIGIIIAVIIIIVVIMSMTDVESNYYEPPIDTGNGNTGTGSGLFGCQSDSNCLLPDKCTDAAVSCIQNTCTYTGNSCTMPQITNYILTVKTLKVPQPAIVDIGTVNEFTFSTKYGTNVGGELWKIENTRYVSEDSNCRVSTDDSWLKPSENLGCYEVEVEWNDIIFKIKNGETKTVNKYLTVYYQLSGNGVYKGEKKGINYNYEFVPRQERNSMFTIQLKDIFDLDLVEMKEKVLINSDASILVSLKNNLFSLEDSGYNIKVTKSKLDEFLPTEKISESFLYGDNNYNFKLPTDKSGIYLVEIVPVFTVEGSQVYFENNMLAVGYYVSSSPDMLNCVQTGCIVGTCQSDGVCLMTSTKHVGGG